MELNIGSGDFLFKHCVNFDLKIHQNKDLHTDVVGDAKHLPFKNNSFDKVYLIHVIEHFHYIDGVNILKDILRILKPIGILLMEVPDVRKAVKYLKDDIQLCHHIFGDLTELQKGNDEYAHRSGWTLQMADTVLKKIGFEVVKSGDGTTHGRPWRDFRIVGQKCVSA